MACVNCDGTERLSRVLLGSKKIPKWYNGKTGNEYGFNYYFNSKFLSTLAFY